MGMGVYPICFHVGGGNTTSSEQKIYIRQLFCSRTEQQRLVGFVSAPRPELLVPRPCKTMSTMRLSDMRLSDMRLSDMRLSDMRLSDMRLSDMRLSDMRLSDMRLSDMRLSDMRLSDMRLSDMRLSDMRLSDMYAWVVLGIDTVKKTDTQMVVTHLMAGVYY